VTHAIGFKVQARQCASCIYRRDSSLDIKRLEAAVADGHGGFTKHRACHHATGGVCCRGFWNRHKNKFAGGQIAQRLNMVVFVDVDTLARTPRRRRNS
jgi:hypothetical protein